MNIKFNKVKIHHFLSFDDAEIDLNDRGYCLVSGINKNPKDAAKSNGSGKSTIWNAISYALVGETVSGLKSNLSNIYFNDGCYVELEFKINDDKYKLIRSKDDKKLGTNLKIFINDEDKSGKGIRESQALLDQYLPDLTSELIGSVIILGQGMPQKFTSNTPSGRKEVLEQLSKSDFMIQDIKNRIANRVSTLDKEIREVEDKLLADSSKVDLYSQQLESNKLKLENLQKESNFDAMIDTKNSELDKLNILINDNKEQIDSLDNEKNELTSKILKETELKDSRLLKVRNIHDEQLKIFMNEKTNLNSNIHTLENEIKNLKNIKDVCPMCGQRIPNVIKPDTSLKELDLENLQNQLTQLNKDIDDDDNDYQNVIKEINDKYKNQTLENQNKLSLDNNNIRNIKEVLNKQESSQRNLNEEIIKLNNLKNNFLNDKKRLEDTILELQTSLNELDKNKLYNISVKENIQKHVEVINKMSTLVKRDFRGFLLTNVIEFIDKKAKEYSSQIFNTNEIDFKLDGNSIDIIFCGKEYENLSGGEKQRVDLIIQFAIRDMLCQYLDFSSNILVLDEITDALDSISCDKVLTFITNELKYIESVFIISHHSDELEIPYDNELIVEKNELGVSTIK